MSKGWDESYYRICVNVLLKHNVTGQMLDVYTVHLGLTETSSRNGMQVILDRAAQNDYPKYFAGDYNCYNTDPAYLITAEQYNDCQNFATDSDSGVTFQSWGGVADDAKTPIDFCFVSRSNFVVESFEICRDKWGDNSEYYLSDHYAIQTNVKMIIQ